MSQSFIIRLVKKIHIHRSASSKESNILGHTLFSSAREKICLNNDMNKSGSDLNYEPAFKKTDNDEELFSIENMYGKVFRLNIYIHNHYGFSYFSHC